MVQTHSLNGSGEAVASASSLRSERRSFREGQITDRQLECLYWVYSGKSANDIGAILGISRRTVEGHLLKVCGHLGVRTRHQAAWAVARRGLLDRFGP